MYFCYLDESGTPQLGAQTSHFILLGVAIPAAAWHEKDRRVNIIKARHGLKDAEIHTGYIARRFRNTSPTLRRWILFSDEQLWHRSARNR